MFFHCKRNSNTMASKRKAAAMASVVEETVDPNDELMFLCLGGGNEVGRSCHILQYKGKTVMVSTILTNIAASSSLGFFSLMPVCIQHMMALPHYLSMMISILARLMCSLSASKHRSFTHTRLRLVSNFTTVQYTMLLTVSL